MPDPKPNGQARPVQNNPVTAATDAKQAYDEVVTAIVEIYRTGQARAIQTLWVMGRKVDEFLTECEKKTGSRYGSFGIDQLGDDLKRQDVSVTGRSSLYHARKVFKTLSFDQIESLAKRGYSTHHVKALLPLSDEVRERVHADMINPKTNQVITVEELNAKIKELQTESAKRAADRAINGPTPAEQIETEADDGPTKTGEEIAQENGYTTDSGEATDSPSTDPEGGDVGEKAPVDPEKAKAMARGAPDYSKPPLPGVKKMIKALNNVLGAVSDAAVSLREVPKVGFDSKVAANNWLQAREELRACLIDTSKYLTEMRKLLEESARDDGLGEFTADTAAEKQAKKKGRKRK